MRRFRPRILAAIGLSLLAAGCAEPNAPAHVVQSLYVAQSVDGVALPVELYVIGTVHRFLDASSIAFESGDEARRIQTIRSVDAAQPAQVELTTDTTFYDVRIGTDTAWLYARCRGPAATCVSPIALVRAGDAYQQVISYDPLRTMTLVKAMLAAHTGA